MAVPEAVPATACSGYKNRRLPVYQWLANSVCMAGNDALLAAVRAWQIGTFWHRSTDDTSVFWARFSPHRDGFAPDFEPICPAGSGSTSARTRPDPPDDRTPSQDGFSSANAMRLPLEVCLQPITSKPMKIRLTFVRQITSTNPFTISSIAHMPRTSSTPILSGPAATAHSSDASPIVHPDRTTIGQCLSDLHLYCTRQSLFHVLGCPSSLDNTAVYYRYNQYHSPNPTASLSAKFRC